jgi:AcrR family transcriptional regulator
MNVNFDAIEPVPSAKEREASRRRAHERQERQTRSVAQRREQLLDVAQALIQSQGVDGLNMRLMARKAGYTAGALYAYFNGKEVILAALQRRVLEGLAQAAGGARAAKLVRASRVDSSPTEASSGEKERPAASARSLFVAQSLAWWRCLARDPDSLQLLLVRVVPAAGAAAQAAQGAELEGGSGGVAGLEDALDVCRHSLQAMGLQESVAYQLHRELLALLLLATASGHAQVGGLESQWTAALDRWLQSAFSPEPPAERVASKVRQQDLFVA